MSVREKLIELGACEESIAWIGDRDEETALRECPREAWLVWIVRNAPDAWREKAFAVLLARKCGESALLWIVGSAPAKWSGKALAELDRRKA